MGLAGATFLLSVAAQVRNLRFYDTDSVTGSIGGTVYWEQPSSGTSGVKSYAVFLATDENGTDEVQLYSDTRVGAWTTAFTFPSGYDIVSNASYSHLLVYLRSSNSSLVDPASICLFDNPTDYERTVYFTTLGYSAATSAKTALVAGCYAQEYLITVDMVATAVWGSDSVNTTSLDWTDDASSTAAFEVSFSTGRNFTDVESEIASHVVDAPVPAVYTGSGSDATYSLGKVQATSIIGGILPSRPDTDIGASLAKQYVELQLASAVTMNKKGWLHITSAATAEVGVQELTDVYFGYVTTTFEAMSGGSTTLSDIDTYVTATTPQCWQVSGDEANDSSCTGSF